MTSARQCAMSQMRLFRISCWRTRLCQDSSERCGKNYRCTPLRLIPRSRILNMRANVKCKDNEHNSVAARPYNYRDTNGEDLIQLACKLYSILTTFLSYHDSISIIQVHGHWSLGLTPSHLHPLVLAKELFRRG